MKKPEVKAAEVPAGAVLAESAPMVPAVSESAVELVVQPTTVVAAPVAKKAVNLDDAVTATALPTTKFDDTQEGPPSALCGADAAMCAL